MATGIKLSRPELNVFVVMGDGDCCSIGAGHWVHGIRYNMDMVVLLMDNNIYGLTKNQTSPTTPEGYPSNTQPRGSYLSPLNPLSVTLGVTNASFVAQTADWVPAHLFATLEAAYRHKGLAFVRILQRCPIWTPDIFRQAVIDPERTQVLRHAAGIVAPEIDEIYTNQIEHDPSDLDAARTFARTSENVRIGLFYRDASRPRYEETRHLPVFTAEQRMEALNAELDRHAV